MRVPDTDTPTARLYLTVGAFTGLAMGSVLVGTLDLAEGWARITWLFVCLLVGAGVGWLFVLAQRPDSPSRAPQPTPEPAPAVDDDPEDERRVRRSTNTKRVLAIDAQTTSTRLKPVPIDAHAAPMAPPDADLELLIEDCDHTVHVPAEEDSLVELSFGELRDRVIGEVHRRAPVPDGAANFVAAGYRSEGPVADDGRCRHGYTFYLFDAARGLRCAATITSRELSLQYRSVSTWPRPAHDSWIDPGELVAIARGAIEPWAEAELWVRVELPVDGQVYTRDPLRIADVDVDAGSVRNATSLRQQLDGPAPSRGECFVLDDLTSWFRGGAVDPDGDFGAAITARTFAQGLRTLDDAALERAAVGLWRCGGPDVSEAIARALDDASSTDEAVELLHLAARLPSGLSTAVLHRVAMTTELDDVRTVADMLFGRRRRGELGVHPDPLAPLDFETSRLAMGKAGLRAIALRSTFDPEGDLFGPLADLGLQVTRARVLCGEAPLYVSTWLRPTRGDTEALVASTPLPMPCHILHVVGSGADTFAQRILDSDIAYDEHAILADASSGSPYPAHRAALYISALRIPIRHVAAPLAEAFRRGRRDANLRRAILRAMEYVEDAGADAFLVARRESDDVEERAMATEILARRVAARMPPDGAETSDDDTQPAQEPA